MEADTAMIDKAGTMLVAAELTRRGVEVASPANGSIFDLLAYRMPANAASVPRFVPVQVQSHAKAGFNFKRAWFERVPGVVLIHVWHVHSTPEFYLMESLSRVAEALGDTHADSDEWQKAGTFNVTVASADARERMQAHRDKWHRITDQLSL